MRETGMEGPSVGADWNFTRKQFVNLLRQIGASQAPAARFAIALSLKILEALFLSYEMSEASETAIPCLARLFQKSRAHG
jgi:hypothetical protein